MFFFPFNLEQTCLFPHYQTSVSHRQNVSCCSVLIDINWREGRGKLGKKELYEVSKYVQQFSSQIFAFNKFLPLSITELQIGSSHIIH